MFSWFKRKKYCYECGHLTRADMMKELRVFQLWGDDTDKIIYYCRCCAKPYDAVSYDVFIENTYKKYKKVPAKYPNKGYYYAECDEDGEIK